MSSRCETSNRDICSVHWDKIMPSEELHRKIATYVAEEVKQR